LIYWTGIILGLVAAVVTAKKGLYEACTFLFNVVIAVYLALTLGPVLKGILAIQTPAGQVFVLFGTAVVSLTVLYALSYVIFLSQFQVKFPKLLDSAGGAMLGFLAGLLIWSFLAFLAWISPLNTKGFLAKIGLDRTAFQSNISYMNWWTERINAAVAVDRKAQIVEQTVALLADNAEKAATAPRKIAEPNQPKQHEKPVEEQKPKPADLGPPPELDSRQI
jgi:hypothetical protein